MISGICILCYDSVNFVWQRPELRGLWVMPLSASLATRQPASWSSFKYTWECCQEVWQTVWKLSLLEELRVQISPFPNINLLSFLSLVFLNFTHLDSILQLSVAFRSNFTKWPLYTSLWFPSALNAHQFFTEESWDGFKQIFDTYMFEASKVFSHLTFFV